MFEGFMVPFGIRTRAVNLRRQRRRRRRHQQQQQQQQTLRFECDWQPVKQQRIGKQVQNIEIEFNLMIAHWMSQGCQLSCFIMVANFCPTSGLLFSWNYDQTQILINSIFDKTKPVYYRYLFYYSTNCIFYSTLTILIQCSGY